MSDAIKKLHDYLAKSPSVVYPEDVFAYLPAIEVENAKLREELAKWEQLAASINLPEYPVTQFKPKDLERENAKLRELVADVHEALCADKAGMFHKLILASMENDMRELGIEVDA